MPSSGRRRTDPNTGGASWSQGGNRTPSNLPYWLTSLRSRRTRTASSTSSAHPGKFDAQVRGRLDQIEKLVQRALHDLGRVDTDAADTVQVQQYAWRLLAGLSVSMPRFEAPDDRDWAEIEATAHTADKAGAFSEIARVLKPGGLFGGYEWCMTSRYDPDNAEHRALKKGIERGNAVPDVAAPATVLAGLEAAGFEVVEARDLAPESDPETPWYSILDQREAKPVSSPGTTGGRRVAALLAQARQGLAFVPKGTSEVLALLDRLVDSTRDAGRLGIFTPLFYFKARKPA